MSYIDKSRYTVRVEISGFFVFVFSHMMVPSVPLDDTV